MSKKTLNEATVRQFMKLVNHKPATISTFIKENYNEEAELEETKVNEEETVVAEAEDELADPVDDAPVDELPPEAPIDDLEPEAELDDPIGGEGEVDITPEMADVLIQLGDMLKAAMPEGDPEADLDAPPVDEPALDADPAADLPPPEEDEEMEMVAEVARRVAQRILKAKKAKKELNEALGKK